jgi:photosystem II stability/assembly factor-like uncharacterized protein
MTARRLWLAGALLLACAAAQARAEISPELASAIETTQRAHPGLLVIKPGDRYLAATGDAQLDALLAGIAAGHWDETSEAAVWSVLEGFSREQGPTATYGRNLTGRVAGLAATSGDAATLNGVARVLERFLADQSHSYSLLAQGLLSEKVRCGAASIGDDALVARVSAEVNPDKELGVGITDGTIADRYGIHPKADLFAVAIRGDSVAAAGYFGSVLISADGGATWSAPATGTDEPLYAVAFGPADELWAAGRGGVVLRSTDGGKSFVRRKTPFDRHVFGLFASAPGTALAVGDFGLQLRTTDGGGRWECIPREEDVILGRVAPAGPDAVVAGEFGTLERWPGGRPPGKRGVLVGVPGDIYVFDVWFDETGKVGVAVGLSGAILRSEDGGANWSRVDSPIARDLYGVGGSGDRVVIVGEGGFAAYSDDAGKSFTPAKLPALPVALTDVEVAASGKAFAVGPRGLVLRSDDRGSSVAFAHGGSAP